MRRLIYLILLFASYSPAAHAKMLPIFGPKQFARDTGKPQTVVDSFQNCEPAAQYQVVVINGDSNGNNRISSASIVLNGTEIVAPEDFNQNVSRIAKPVVVLPSNRLETTLRSAPGSFLMLDIECLSGCLDVAITSPVNSGSIAASLTNVFGNVTSSADEVGVVVNSQVGLVQSGRFAATDLPLTLGPNTVSVTATNSCGAQAITTEVIQATDSVLPTVTLTPSPITGVAPLAVSFSAVVSSSRPILSYQWDLDGDGTVDASGPALSQTSATYSQPGLFIVTVTATDTGGQQFVGQTPVIVLSAEALNSLLKGKWQGFKVAMANQNFDAALQFFLPSTRDQFQSIFADLGSQVASNIASQLDDIGLLSTTGGLATCVTIRQEAGKDAIHFVQFMRDEKGLWKIESM